jgi:UDP-glucose 4-epimerase
MYIEDAVQAVYELYRHLPSEKDSLKISEIVNVASRDTRVLRSFVEEVWNTAPLSRQRRVLCLYGLP